MAPSPLRQVTDANGATLRVVVADTHEVVRKGFCLLLEAEFGCEVLEAPSPADAVRWAQDPAVDVVLLDVCKPQGNGVDVLAEIRQVNADIPVLVLSIHEDPDTVRRAIDAGANGYLLKEASTAQLAEAIETAVRRGGLYLHPSVAQSVFQLRQTTDRYAESLSDRELAVLTRVAEGATNETIAGELYVSEKTVKSHLTSVFRKLEVSNRTEAAAKAIRERIIDLSPVGAAG